MWCISQIKNTASKNRIFEKYSGIVYNAGMNRKAEKQIPYFTIILIAVNVIYFFIIEITGDPENSLHMLDMGANFSPLVFEEHEYYRLISCMFMHFSISHLMGNMIYLGIVGYNFECRIGHLRFLIIYMLSGFGASLLSSAYYQITKQYTVSAGASGAVYGLMAMVVYLTVKYGRRTNRAYLTYRILILAVFLFYSNFINADGVDVAAHIGGLAFGFLLSFLLLKPDEKKH